MLGIPLGVLLAGFAGLSDFIGSALVLAGGREAHRWFDWLLPFGTGFVLAIALAELVPAGLEGGSGNAVWVLVGFSTLYLITRLLENEETDGAGGIRSLSTPSPQGGRASIVSGIGLTVVGVTLCDFFDGFAVAASVGEEQLGGWLLLLGLFPHNFLEGSGIALLLVSAGLSRRWAWGAVTLLGLASLLGGVAVQAAFAPGVQGAVQAFAGGLLLHLVASQRIPAFSGSKARSQAVLVVLGIGAFLATEALVGAAGIAP